MKVSIVTAVRNGAAHIAATLESVAKQTHPDIEHIIIDGASTDATLRVVAAHDQRVARLVSEPDRGVYDAFNKGLARATGDVVAYLNAGDTYSSATVIADVVRELERGDVDVVFGDVVFTAGPDGRIVRRYRSAAFSPRRLAYGYMPAHPALFMRRAVYEKFGKYDDSYRIAGDFEFVARAMVRGSASYRHIEQVLVHMPRGGLSSSGWRSHVTITREMQRACRSNGVRTNLLLLLTRLPVKFFNQVLART